jgi:hypothetical protein
MPRERRLPAIDAVLELLEHIEELPERVQELLDVVLADLERANLREANARDRALVEQIPKVVSIDRADGSMATTYEPADRRPQEYTTRTYGPSACTWKTRSGPQRDHRGRGVHHGRHTSSRRRDVEGPTFEEFNALEQRVAALEEEVFASPSPSPSLSPSPSPSAFDRVLTGSFARFTVPAGETWKIEASSTRRSSARRESRRFLELPARESFRGSAEST